MNIAELFRRLSYGEFSNLAIGVKGTGTIEADKQDRVIYYANEALTRLFTRFPLREEAMIIELKDWVTNYHFSKRYAESNPDPIPGDPIYIMDEASPYQDNLIKVQAVYHQTMGKMPLNDASSDLSLYTPAPQTLLVPHPKTGVQLEVVYQCKHPKLVYGDLEQCIDLTPTLHGALTAWIAHMVYGNMNGAENRTISEDHLAKYEYICREVESQDMVNATISTTNTKFHERGFV